MLGQGDKNSEFAIEITAVYPVRTRITSKEQNNKFHNSSWKTFSSASLLVPFNIV